MDDLRRGSLLMGAVVLAYTALEGFLNHVIEVVFPETWSQERAFFRKHPYEGTLGKARFLADRLHVALPRDARPYSSVAELHAWRNALAHPRTVRRRGVAKAIAYARKPASARSSILSKLWNRGFVERSFGDVEMLADGILAAAATQPTPEARELATLAGRAFLGPTGSGHASLKG